MRRPFFRSSFEDINQFFREMQKTMEKEFTEISRKAPKELVRERVLPDGTKVKEWGPFVYGYSATRGKDGKPKIREFGNVNVETRKGKPYIDTKEKREPLVDVMTVDDEVKVIVELPGVEKKDIKLHTKEDRLTISVDAPQRKYYKETELPVKVDPKHVETSYKNGVLEVTLQKTKRKKRKDNR